MRRYAPIAESLLQIPSRGAIVDSLLIGVISIVLTGIHFFIPAGIQSQLAIDYSQFNLTELFTSAYVHHNNSHLWSNVSGFVAAATVANFLCRMTDERRWFHLSLGTLLLISPILVTFTSYSVITHYNPSMTGTGRGFSGVAAGFAGFVFVALVVLLADAYSVTTAQYIGQAVILGLLAEVAFIYGGGNRIRLVGLALGGVMLSVWWAVNNGTWPGSQDAWKKRTAEALFIGSVVMLLGVFVYSLFPAQIANGDATTNIIAHGVGFVYGASLVSVIFLVLKRNQVSEIFKNI